MFRDQCYCSITDDCQTWHHIGLPERKQMACRETVSIMKEALVELMLGWCPLMTWVFVTKITC
jgi:hypothetical protein